MNPENVTPNAAEILARTGHTADELFTFAQKRFAESRTPREFGWVEFEFGGERLFLTMDMKGDGSDARIMTEIDSMRESVKGADGTREGTAALGLPVGEDSETEAKRAFLRMMDEACEPEPEEGRS